MNVTGLIRGIIGHVIFGKTTGSEDATIDDNTAAPILIDDARRVVVAFSSMGQADADNSISVVLASDQTPLPYQEAQAAVAEDNTNGVFAFAVQPLATNTYAPSIATNFGTATKANVKSSAGNVLQVHAHNANGSGRFLLIHNKSSAPAAADVPLVSLWIPAGEARSVKFTGSGLYCSSGIGWSFGTTAGTFTDSATASEHGVTVEYK